MTFLIALALNLGKEVLEPHRYLSLLMLSPGVRSERQGALVEILLHRMNNLTLLSLHHVVPGLALQIEELFIAD
jgi:hypothetical protein